MIKPLKKNVLIDIHKSEFTAMQQVDEKEAQLEKATVLEVGDEVETIKKNDIIVFKAYNLDTIELDGKKYNLIPEEDIKGIVLSDSISSEETTLNNPEQLRKLSDKYEAELKKSL